MNVSNKVFGVANAASLDAEDDQFSDFFQKFLAATCSSEAQHACSTNFPTVELGSVCSFRRSNSLLNKNFFAEEGLPYIQYGQIHKGELTTVSDYVVTYIDPIHCANVQKARKGEVIITDVSEDVEGAGKSIVWMGEEEVVTSQHCFIATPDANKLDSVYLAYFLKSYKFFEQKRRFTYGSYIFQIYTKDLEKCLIPLPPLEIQQEIGKFLFLIEGLYTNKKTGIAKEIELREIQFEQYLDLFTAFDQSILLRDLSPEKFELTYSAFVKATVPNQDIHTNYKFPIVKIGSVCKFSKGNSSFNKDCCGDVGLPFLHYSQIQTKEVMTKTSKAVSFIAPEYCNSVNKLITAKKGEVILTSSSIGMPGVALPMVWDGEEELVTSQDCIHIKVDTNKLDPLYLAYYFKSHSFFVQKHRISYGSGIFHIYAKDIAKCTMPLPPLEVQKSIANFLYSLEQLITDKKHGLLYEQQLRQTQLTFMIDRFFS